MSNTAPIDLPYLRAKLQRVLELPFRALPDSPPGTSTPAPDGHARQRVAALSALFHSDAVTAQQPLVFGWHRTSRGGAVELVTTVESAAPPGSRSIPAGDAVDAVMATPAWVQVAVRPVGSDAGDDRTDPTVPDPHRSNPPSVESTLLEVWDRPFTLLVIASPVSQDDAVDAVESTSDASREAKAHAEQDPDFAIEHERLQWWHRELRNGETTGLWWVRVVAGGEDERSARALSALASTSFDAASVGYALTPMTGAGGRRRSFVPAHGRAGKAADNAGPHGFMAGTELLSALTRPPASEVPGIRLVMRSEFDTTPETGGVRGSIPLGRVLDRQRRPAERFNVQLSSLNRHTFLPGATGAGKSITTRTLVSEARRAGVHCTVIEPAKAEYARGLAARLPGEQVVRIAPGDPDQVACAIDPMRPVEGFPLQTHIDLTKSLFLAAFDADEPFPQVLAASLQRAYEQQGWHTVLSTARQGRTQPRYPTLGDLQQSARQVVDEIGYGPEVHQNIQGFVRVRLGSLRLGTTGRFLEGGHPLDMERLLRSTVVFEIENVGDDAEKAFIIGAFLIKLVEHYRVLQQRGQITRDALGHLTVIEEAHRLLRNPEGNGGAASNAVEMFASLLAEVRAYGEGIVIAEQIPSKLIPDAIKNTAVKVVHRLPAADDREAVGATMNLSDAQSEYLVTVQPGEAAVYTDGMDRPVLVKMPDETEVEQRSRAEPVGPDALVEPTLGRCGADYGLGGLTLARLAEGQALIEDDAVVRWWIELSVVAHLTGRTVPAPDLNTRRRLADHDGIALRAGLAWAVDEAVASRTEAVSPNVPVAELARHVFDDVQGVLDHNTRCEHLDPRHLCGRYRFEHIWLELIEHIEGHPDGEPCGDIAPASPDWYMDFGLHLPQRDCLAQQAALARIRRRARTDSRERELYILGTASPSVLENTLGLARTNEEWNDEMRTMIDHLEFAGWAIEDLYQVDTPTDPM